MIDIWLIFSTKQGNYRATIMLRNKTGYSESEGSENQVSFCVQLLSFAFLPKQLLWSLKFLLLFPNIN